MKIGVLRERAGRKFLILSLFERKQPGSLYFFRPYLLQVLIPKPVYRGQYPKMAVTKRITEGNRTIKAIERGMTSEKRRTAIKKAMNVLMILSGNPKFFSIEMRVSLQT